MVDVWGTVDELPYGRSGTPFSTGARTYTRRFLLEALDPRVDPLICALHPLMPRPYDPFISSDGLAYDLNALCVEARWTQKESDDWSLWVGEYQYTSDLGTKGYPDFPGMPNANGPGGGNQNNPELEPPEVSWDMEVQKVALQKDLDGKAFLCSNGLPFSPAPTFDMAFAVLRLTRNEYQFDRAKASKYAFAVNKDNFLGAKPGAAQCYPPTAVQKYLGKKAYFRTTYKIRFAQELSDGSGTFRTWQPELLNQGVMEKFTPDSKPTAIYRGGVISQPVLLNDEGSSYTNLLAPDQPVDGPAVYLPVTTPSYTKYRVYPKLSFRKLIARGVQ